MVRFTEHVASFFDWVCSASMMAAVLVALILLLQRVLKDRLKPRWLYLMWLLVILRLILPWGPESEFSIYNWIGYSGSFHSDGQINQEAFAGADQGAAYPAVYHDVLVVLWAAGACLLAMYTVWVNWTFAIRMKKETAAVTDARILKLFHECKTRMRVHSPIELVQSRHMATPALFGFLKPALIIPRHIADSLNDDQLRHIFLHELAHSKRNDIKVNGLMYALLVIHWFNPVLWYAYRRMRDDQEIASDALALSCLAPDQRQDYGYTLIKLLESFSLPARTVGNVNLIGSKDQLQRRMKMIKQFQSKSYRWSFLGMAIIVFISGCTLTDPKGSSSSAPLAGSAITEEKPAGIEQSAASEQEAEQPPASGEQQQTVADDAAKQSASAADQPANPDPQPESAAENRAAVSELKPVPAAPAREQIPVRAEPRSPAPAQETRAAAQAERPIAVPSDRSPAPAPAPSQPPRLVPSESDRAEAAQRPARPMPLAEVRASSDR